MQGEEGRRIQTEVDFQGRMWGGGKDEGKKEKENFIEREKMNNTHIHTHTCTQAHTNSMHVHTHSTIGQIP